MEMYATEIIKIRAKNKSSGNLDAHKKFIVEMALHNFHQSIVTCKDQINCFCEKN